MPAKIATLLLLVSAACTRGEALQQPRDALKTELIGCYALYTPAGKLLDSTFYNSSPLVRLDSTPLGITARDTVPGVFRRLVRLDSNGRPIDPDAPRFRAWWADSLTDSVRLSFSDGFSGAQVILAASGRGDTLVGRIEEHWDFAPPNSRGRVRAIRVHC
jgi:hypothetical protein